MVAGLAIGLFGRLEGVLVELEGDLLGDLVVDGPERRDDSRRTDLEERLGDARVVPEEVLPGADLADIEEHERRAL